MYYITDKFNEEVNSLLNKEITYTQLFVNLKAVFNKLKISRQSEFVPFAKVEYSNAYGTNVYFSYQGKEGIAYIVIYGTSGRNCFKTISKISIDFDFFH